MWRVMALLLTSLLGTASACEPRGTPELELLITPAEIWGDDTRIEVRVHGNDCAELVRPAHFVEPGRFVLALTAAERGELLDLASRPSLANFSSAAVRAELASARSAGEPEQPFEVLDADRFEVRVNAGGDVRELRLAGVPQYAERYPEHAQLRDFAALVDALSALQQRAGRRALNAHALGGVQP